MTNKITVDIDTMNSANLGIKGLNVTDKNGTAATYAIDAISDAIAKVSSQRSALGAVQNRLEHTIDNLDNISENTSSAESRIRDTDMAKEMVNYSKNNILAQAGQSMLAQAKYDRKNLGYGNSIYSLISKLQDEKIIVNWEKMLLYQVLKNADYDNEDEQTVCNEFCKAGEIIHTKVQELNKSGKEKKKVLN